MSYTFKKVRIPGMYLITPSIFEDSRGRLTKTYYEPDYVETLPINDAWGEIILSDNKRGVFRGLHFQKPPFAQAKTLCCVSGSIIDWALDIRRGSPTYGLVERFELDSMTRQILYVPVGIANGYYTKEDNTTILYNLTSRYDAQSSSGISWKSIGLDLGDAIISDKDNDLEDWNDFDSPFKMS